MIQDAGGVILADGRSVRTGLVYRVSGMLAGPDELSELSATGVRAVVDLRDEAEDRSTIVGWTEANGVTYENFPIVVAGYEAGRWDGIVNDIASGRGRARLLETYAELAIGFGPQIAAAFEVVSRVFPSAFGCAAGKDRTGVMCAYLHVLLGASEETAIQAYLDMAPNAEQLKPAIDGLGLEPDDPLLAGIADYMLVKPTSMAHAFGLVNEHGGVEAFLREHGLSQAAIDRLRDQLIAA
jgi:protein-tyrosine phosphatase